jgi:hypothetical protein
MIKRSIKIVPSIICFLMLLSAFGVSKDQRVQSRWTAERVRVDGYPTDWDRNTLTSEDKHKIEYGFRNDAENIYVLFVFKDPKVMSSIAATGMTIWFHPEGKKKDDYGILFIQRKITADQMIARLEKQRGALSDEEKERIGANPSYLVFDTEMAGKKGKSQAQSSQESTDKPATFRYMKLQDVNVFEFGIPLERMNEQLPSESIVPGKSLKIGFQWGGATKEMREEIMRRSRTLERTRANVSEDVGSREGMSGTEGASRGLLQAPKEYKIWVNVDLSSKS